MWLPGRRPCRGWNQSSRRLMNFCSLMNMCTEDPMEERMGKAQTCQGRNTIAKFRGAILNNRLKGWKLKTEQNKAPHHPGCLGEPFTLINAASQGHWRADAGTTTRRADSSNCSLGCQLLPGINSSVYQTAPAVVPPRLQPETRAPGWKAHLLVPGSWTLGRSPQILLHKKEAPALLFSAGSTDCVGFWLGLRKKTHVFNREGLEREWRTYCV